MIFRCYSELKNLKTYTGRFDYLKCNGEVGFETFGFDRYLNQALYNSPEWKKVRREVILRDNGCDLGIEGYEINERVIIHHMNPITIEQVMDRDPVIFDPEYLIATTHRTHNAIHYGDSEQIYKGPRERKPFDTCPWKH